MSVIGVPGDTQKAIMKLIAAILHLGNVSFKEDENNKAVPDNHKGLETTARLLSIEKDVLEDKLTSVIMESRWGGQVDITKKTLNADQAQGARDALAKAIYAQTFDYLVEAINNAMQKEKEELSIGVLDIYGFEIFEANGFEQFSINYVNEKLQQIFIELTLKTEQEEYIAEGITWSEIKYFNNKIVCELIESKRPPGIMSVLNDVCSTMHAVSSGSERTLMEKLKAVVGSSKDFGRYFQAQTRHFTITHYAGKVSYEAVGFAEKNKDTLSNDLISLMQASRDSFLQGLFPENVYCDSSGRRAKQTTGSMKIKSQCNALVAKIMGCTPHYVRCIKPSESKRPLDWDNERVLHQVVYLGLKENIRVRRAGFAFRKEFEKIVQRYGIIAPEITKGWSGDPRDGCNFILTAAKVDASKWQIGKTKLFLKEPNTIKTLEGQRNNILSKFAIVIQKYYRGYLGRKWLKEMKRKIKAAGIIWRYFKQYRARCELQRKKAIKAILAGLDVLKDNKQLTDAWKNMEYKGDYIGFDGNVKLRKLLGAPRVEMAVKVTKYSREAAEHERHLILTTAALYFVGKGSKSDIPYQIQHRLSVKDILTISLSPFDDSFILLQCTIHDILIESAFLPEIVNRVAAVFQTETKRHLKFEFSKNMEQLMKDGTKRKICFVETGKKKLSLSPSRKNLTISVQQGKKVAEKLTAVDIETQMEDDYHEITDLQKLPTTMSKMLKKTHKKLNTFVIPENANTAIVKAMFGPAGGELSCCSVSLRIPEGACPTKALECCFLICKNPLDHAPVTRGEHLVSPILTLMPFVDFKFNVPVELKIPYSRSKPNKFDKMGKLVRWTETEPGKKSNWHDFLPPSGSWRKRNSEELYDVKLEKDCVKIMIDCFGIFCVIAYNKKIRAEDIGKSESEVAGELGSSEENKEEEESFSMYDTVTNAFRKVGEKFSKKKRDAVNADNSRKESVFDHYETLTDINLQLEVERNKTEPQTVPPPPPPRQRSADSEQKSIDAAAVPPPLPGSGGSVPAPPPPPAPNTSAGSFPQPQPSVTISAAPAPPAPSSPPTGSAAPPPPPPPSMGGGAPPPPPPPLPGGTPKPSPASSAASKPMSLAEQLQARKNKMI